MSYWETPYARANELFDLEVFAGPEGRDLLDAYNDRDDDEARDALFDIVNEMAEAENDDAMRAILRERKHEFMAVMSA
jgi:hypothetical protein